MTTNPPFVEKIKSSFAKQTMMGLIGAELSRIEPGVVEITLPYRADLAQQHGYVHAGVVATMADHSSGMAAGTMCLPGRKVLTVEFKINLMRPGTGTALTCRAEVVRPGKTLSVTEAKVFAADGKAIALMTATMALVE